MDVRELHELKGLIGHSGHRRVFLGFAPATLLHRASVADVLDEDHGKGYQRKFDRRHSQGFRRYILSPGATTIPLTFNLRPGSNSSWDIVDRTDSAATLRIDVGARPLYQVDCQHRLGFLADQLIELPFMAFLGLSHAEEMEVFNTINANAKGLSTSLLDYHLAQLTQDLEKDRPELFIALRLHEDERSPWHRQLDLGGSSTSGLKRRASLRTMQKATHKFLKHSCCLRDMPTTPAFEILLGFWQAVASVLEPQWREPRKHFLTKGIGVYALSTLAADLYIESKLFGGMPCDRHYFSAKLSDFATDFDWRTSGPLRGLGGEAGVNEAVHMLRELRQPNRKMVIVNG